MKHQAENAGKAYHFCSAGRRTKFIAEPANYLHEKPVLRAELVAPGPAYTCPMHPQIRLAGLGARPICGMALEPETPTGETGPNSELVDFTRRFWIGLVLTLLVSLLEMGGI